MGGYLSEPIKDKESADFESDRLLCGASSMQGWRENQEDAHNCCLNYDENVSLFAVYDGHGGQEVAQYCEKNLPDFIKNTEAYKNGDYEKALIDGFLGFDATIITPEVIKVLEQMSGRKLEGSDVEDESEENVKDLFLEAKMPLDQLVAKYRQEGAKIKFDSPALKAPRKNDGGAGPSTSRSDDGDIPSSSSQASSSKASEPSSSTSNGELPLVNGDAKHDDDSADKAESSGKAAPAKKQPEESGGGSSSKAEAASSSKADAGGSSSKADVGGSSSKADVGGSSSKADVGGSSSKAEVGGSSSKCDEPDSSGEPKASKPEVSSTSNGEVDEHSPSAGGDISSSSGGSKRSARSLTRKLLMNSDVDSDSDSDDVDFEGDRPSDEEDEDDEGDSVAVEMGDDDDEDDDDDEEEEEDEDEEDEDGDDARFSVLPEEPGMDSGCTAVVALVVGGRQLFVANAGDSRCVVCRSGAALDMSQDHKPEDEPEMQRILAAGGTVKEGRVNKGLNLSRAIGDFTYKKNESLPATEQMIIALPDVKKLEMDPAEDEFMVLACDGIWNSMTSQEVVDFVKPKLQEGVPISKICEQMFDHCLAPNTLGDGTGCDNMTCIIVKFKDAKPHAAEKRRAASPGAADAKRQKTEEETAAAATEPATA